jgi:hypothetical protein
MCAMNGLQELEESERTPQSSCGVDSLGACSCARPGAPLPREAQSQKEASLRPNDERDGRKQQSIDGRHKSIERTSHAASPKKVFAPANLLRLFSGVHGEVTPRESVQRKCEKENLLLRRLLMLVKQKPSRNAIPLSKKKQLLFEEQLRAERKARLSFLQ